MKKIKSITYCSPRSTVDVKWLSGNFPVICKDLWIIVGKDADFLVELGSQKALFVILYEDNTQKIIDVNAAYLFKHKLTLESDWYLDLQTLYI